ncbi:hypothetical protein [Micromonospora saelicesensis]|nr:hypothetical protein [Micromonospora saelicesensis]
MKHSDRVGLAMRRDEQREGSESVVAGRQQLARARMATMVNGTGQQ